MRLLATNGALGRVGDPAVLVSDTESARGVLDWQPQRDLCDRVSDALTALAQSNR